MQVALLRVPDARCLPSQGIFPDRLRLPETSHLQGITAAFAGSLSTGFWSWHGGCIHASMKIRNDIITRIEFVGGPEDGRILDLSECPALITAEEAEDVGKVPMFLAMDNLEGFEEGDELELIILGHYVSYRSVGNCAKFDWIPMR